MTGEELKEWREAHKMTREALAKQLVHCTASTINKWERGINPVPAWVAEKLLSNIKVELPLGDLHALLDYARESGESFEEFLSQAVREYLAKHKEGKSLAPKTVKPGLVSYLDATLKEPALKVAEEKAIEPPTDATSEPPRLAV